MSDLTPAEAKAIRKIAKEPRLPVAVIPGDAAPRLAGESAYHTFQDSDSVVRSPGAARRAGHKLTYHRSTLRIIVGAQWMATQRFLHQARPLWKKIAAKRREILKKLKGLAGAATMPPDIVIDFLEEQGYSLVPLLREEVSLTTQNKTRSILIDLLLDPEGELDKLKE